MYIRGMRIKPCDFIQLERECDNARAWSKAWKSYARHARGFAHEAYDAAMQHQEIHMALYAELRNRLLAGVRIADGGWEYSCRVCGVRGSNDHALQHDADCPLSIPDNIRNRQQE